MAFVVVLDTCVLFPAHLRDTFLRLAEIELFVPVWSAHIIGELERNLIEYRVAPAAVARLTGLMGETFPDASVVAYEDLIPSMTCHEKDRHVLAAAVRAGASLLVTFNLRDFAARAPILTRSTSSTLTTSFSTCSILLPPCRARRAGPTGGRESATPANRRRVTRRALQVRGPAIRRRGPTTWIALAPQLASSLRPSGTGSGAWRNLAT